MFINLLILIINILLRFISVELKTQLRSQSAWFQHLAPPFNYRGVEGRLTSACPQFLYLSQGVIKLPT